MRNMFLVGCIVLALLLINEWLWRKRTHGELSRKFVHISVGTFVALWPLLLSWHQIELLSILFVSAVIVSRRFNIFKAIHAVDRTTWGELFFGAAVGLVALITQQSAVYAVALLHMSLADGLAAVIGQKYGRRSMYKIFGAKKSRAGTLTFLVVSLGLLSSFCLWSNVSLGLWLPVIALTATLLENVAVRGIDNLLIPVFVALLLRAVV